MFFRMIASFSFIFFVCLLIPFSQEENKEVKGWLDRCDLGRLREGLKDASVEPVKPSTIKPPGKPSSSKGTSWAWDIFWKQKLLGLRPLADKEELLEALKQKFLLDSKGRGSKLEAGDWTKDARGFISDFYNDYYDEKEERKR